ncbi:hypothetical protein DL95DRAFT_470117 [Leptodontidium sp. 2 PMI_412]|nr:hypothetical protein DL95DRAFT_470117 [Leptodontidium sp. 2 PMI_412]
MNNIIININNIVINNGPAINQFHNTPAAVRVNHPAPIPDLPRTSGQTSIAPPCPSQSDPLVLHAINVSRGRKETTLDVDVSNAAGRGTSRKVVLQNESKTISKAGVMVTIQPSDVAWDSDTDKIVILTVQPRISAGKLECLESMTGMLQDDKSVLPIKSQYLNLIPRL